MPLNEDEARNLIPTFLFHILFPCSHDVIIFCKLYRMWTPDFLIVRTRVGYSFQKEVEYSRQK